MTSAIRLTTDETVATLMLDRPEALNAFGIDMADELARQLTNLASDPQASAVILTGAGRAFCAGGDLGWARQHPQGLAAAFHELAGRFHQAILEIRHMRKPVIAAINGVAAGGGFSLALACDFRLLADDATVRQAYTSSGLCMDGGGTFMLPRLVGHARALEILAFDDPIPADRALAWGLVNELVPRSALMSRAREIGRRLTARSLHTFGWSKQLLNASFATSLEAQLERERRALETCASHPDGREGLQAFAEKRPPAFISARATSGEPTL
jgi:2-(1,2-epoxy-1,2-dihydrophenyl)acetyl-CoA isomerase